MKVLILIAEGNFDGKSNAYTLAYAAENALTQEGNEVRVVDLCKKGFNETASFKDLNQHDNSNFNFLYASADSQNLGCNIQEQQENIKWCTHIIVCGPIWWHGLPSSFYCYFERVFTLGFGYTLEYRLDKGYFKDKKVMIAVTTGAQISFYTRGGYFPLEATLYPITAGHFGYCGFQIMRSQGFHFVKHALSDEIIEKWKKAIVNLDNRPILELLPPGEGPSNIERFAQLPDYTLDDAIAAKK
ncbi:NAD(P)H dehydrogenase (quinone) activity protein [Tritrichomonas musculus]|uniref:NAD(P)H dehydrogenase (Quinone) activity protein n=1 Tax=Tritrichomonas musculus TaxID=1915356 RepID=A0ABR2GQ06_9EUKA